MKKLILPFIICFLTLNSYSQINMADSTVQVVGYWNINETQSYSMSYKKFKIKENDTIEKQLWTYDVDITVVDSTGNSFTMEWFYKNYKVQTDNKLIEKLSSICENLKVRIKTDELGAFVSVENPEVIKNELSKVVSVIKEEFKNIPNMDKLCTQVENMYSSKEAIEKFLINDIQQFYTFHGGAYKLGEEVTANVKVPNLYGGAPLMLN